MGKRLKNTRVEEGFERQPMSEAQEAGEHIGETEDVPTSTGIGGEHRGVLAHEPSSLALPYMSEEEQNMEMTPEIIGPPGYGSPDPTSSAGRLAPVDDHPLNARNLPEGSEVAISPEYGQNVVGTTLAPPAQGGHLSGPGANPIERQDLQDIERDAQGRDPADAYEADYTKEELLGMAADREIAGRSDMNKRELAEALAEDDYAAASGETADEQ